MDVIWPPSGEQAVLLGQLAEMIERGGAAHLLEARVVRMDERDFPDPWETTAVAVQRLLARMFWHAYVDLEVGVDDLRGGGGGRNLLSRSAIEWIETKDGVAEFQLESIGNDNVAGALSHEIGRAYLGWMAAATPYRDDRGAPDARVGTIAAVYLGLGVLAANAAEYRRTAGEIRGRTAVTEWDVVTTGGLPTDDILYLLAVQAVLRGGVIDAHATLRGELRDRLRDAIAALQPHRDALAVKLGLDLDAPRTALERDAAPARVDDDARPEPDFHQRWSGIDTYRVGEHRLGSRLVLGLLLGGAAAVAIASRHLSWWPIAGYFAIAGAFGIAGAIIGLRTRRYRCYYGKCGHPLRATATVCPGCGAKVAGPVEDFREELARRAEEEDDRLDAIRIAAERESRSDGSGERDDA